MQALIERLRAWNNHWADMLGILENYNRLPLNDKWRIRPWLFVPREYVARLLRGLKEIRDGGPLRFEPLITTLEMVQPWNYCTYDRHGERLELKDDIPEEMRV